jgi:hypothetical protein
MCCRSTIVLSIGTAPLSMNRPSAT